MFPEKDFPRRLVVMSGAAALLLLACGIFLPPASEAPQQPPVQEEARQPETLIILPGGETPTPFLPLPITGTPPPTSTPFPTPPPTSTPTPTPWLHPTFAPPSIPVYGIPAPFPLLSPEHQINFLLLGSDSRGGVSFRTDVIMIVMVDVREKLVTLVSLPRDLWVYIPGWTMQRINTAYLHGELDGYPGGGMALVKDTIRYNLGIRIDHVALVDFNGFRRIVDRVGGVDVPLVCPFTEWTVIDPNVSIENESNWKLTTIGPGIVHMDGDRALWYVRARMRSNDFDRGRRQQEVIRALYTAAIDENLILQAPGLYDEFKDTITTDVGLQTILSLAAFGLELDEAEIRSYYVGDDLTWGWTTPGGASVLLPNADAIYKMLLEAVSPPENRPAPGEEVMVEVWNWSSQENYDVLAAERLHYAGYETSLQPPLDKDARKTVLYDLTPDQDPERSAALISYLGLNADRLIADPQTDAPAAFRLVIGNDYDPCFNPTDN